MPVPILSRVRQRPVKLDKDILLAKALDVAKKPAVLKELPKGEQDQVDQMAKAIQFGSGWTTQGGRRGGNAKPVSAAVIAARAAHALGPSSSITPVDIAVAMQAQGLDWVQPFPPGQPLVPYYGYTRRPRQYDYRVGRNITTETRPDRIPFATLLQLWKSYDVAQTCTRYSINDLRSMRVRFEAADGWEENPVKEIAEAKRFLRRPDGKWPLRSFLAQNQRNLWIFDSAPVYRLRDKAGRLKHLKNFSAMTLAPMLDYYGDFPEAPAPAFQQFIEGIPWDWLTWEHVIYIPFWPETDSPYGTPPLETVLVNANTDVRLQLFFLDFFTKGTVPEAFALAPETMTSPDDIADFQEQYNSETYGDQSERWGLKWLPHGTEIQPYKPQSFDPTLAEYVMRRTISAFGLTPQNLGILSTVNRATATTQVDQQFRVSTLPIVGYYEDLLDSVLQTDLTLPVQVRFDTGREKEDRLMEAQAHQIYVAIGAESSDEVREKVLGYPTNPEEKVPRFWDSVRLGPVPLEWLMSVAGTVDPLTGAPRPGTVERREFIMVGQTAPDPLVTPAQPQYADAATHDAKRGRVVRPKDPGVPVSASREKVYQPLGQPGVVKSGSPNDDEPYEPLPTSQTPAEDSTPAKVGPGDAFEGYGRWSLPGGSTGQGTGATGGSLSVEEAQDLRRWQRQSRDRVKKGRTPRAFASSAISPQRQAAVWSRLEAATTRDQVDEAFTKAKGPLAAGIVVQATDTGRVLMVRRTPDKHDPDEAYARWEFPGGKLTGDNPWAGATREWGEETGATLPPNFVHQGNWTSPDGVYVGYVVSVPTEDSLTLRPTGDEVTEARWWDKADLDDPVVRDKVTDTLDRVTPLLKGWTAQPRDPSGRFATAREARRRRFHRFTDRIVNHYAPLIEAELAKRLTRAAVQKVAERAYRAATATAKPASTPVASMPKVTPAAAAIVAGAGAAVVGAPVVGGLAASGVLMASAVPIAAQLAAGAIVGTGAATVAALSALYADAYLQGAHGAAEATGGQVPPWMLAVPVPDGYWDNWKPGVARAAEKVAGTGLAQLLAEAGVTIKGIEGTQLARIANAIAEGIENGVPIATVTRAIDEIVATATRAKLIAETEYARAMAVAQMDVYRRNGVPEVTWLHQPGACWRCMENVAASPQPTANPQWPQGPIPVHPHERCAVAPYYGSLTGG